MIRRALALLPAACALLAFPRPLAGAVGEAFVPIPACRAVDTRNPAGPLGGPALGASEARIFTIAGTCGVPADALGLTVNITVVGPSATGFAQLYAGDAATPPGTTVLNFTAGKTRAGNAFVALASDASGTVTLVNASAGPAHFLIDVTSYLKTACVNTIVVSNPSTATGTVNAPFSQTFTQAGGTGTTAFSTASPLPAGLALASNGTLSGTPTQPGSFPITVTATDANGCTGTGATYTLVIACQTVSVTNPATATGVANAPFSQTFTQTGGVGTTTFTTSSPLPIGLTLAANGVLSGTPTQAGAFPIVVVATDANGCTGTGATYNLVISCQTISVTNPATASGTANAPFSQTFTQAGAIGTATFTTSSTLPAGLLLAANGVLSGTPTQTGTFPIVVTVTDGNLCTGTSATYNLVIGCQTIAVTNPATATGTANTPFSQTFTQAGGIGAVAFTTASTLPTGLTLAANGTLSGTPTQTGTFPIVVTATDANGCAGLGATYNLVVACQSFTVNPATVPQGTTGVAYPAVVFSHAGGIGAVAFALTGALPIGMNFTPGTATLDGLPTQSGSFPVTVTATDANGCTASRDYLLVIVCSGTSITLSPASLPSVVVGAAFPAQVFSASGGTGPYTFAEAGALPSGMSFVTDTLSGTPTQTGSFPITISATDTVGLCVGSQDYVITVTCVGVTITVAPPTIPPVAAGSPFGPVTFTASGGTGPHTFAVAGGLPSGMTFSVDTLTGTPTQQGTFPFTITATDAAGCVGSTAYSLVVTCPTITVTNPATTTGTVSTPFSQTFTQTGGNGPITFSLASGTLPSGLLLDANTGVLSGTPTESGSFPITVKATDANGCTGTGATHTLVIACQTITVTNPVVNSGADGAPFSQTFTQTGAIGGATFSLASGSLPAGWTLTSAGVLANAAPTPVQFTITVLVTDGNGCTGTGASYTVSILPAAAADTYAPAIVGNMSIDTATGTAFSVLSNDSAGTTANLVGGGTTAQGGTVTLASAGQFTYAPPRGYEGPDSFQYTATHTASGLTSGPATVSLTVTGVVWFVDNNPGACSSGCDGRRATPYTTLAALQAVNDGTGTNPKINHRIFLFESNPANAYVGPVTLLNGQSLIGQDFTGTFATATGLAVPDTTVAVPVMDSGNGFITEVTNGVATNAINLVTDASVIGLKASATSGIAISQAAVPPGPGSAPLGVTTLTEVNIATAGTATALSVLSTTGSLTYVSGSVVASGSNSVSAVFIQGGTSAITVNVPITSTGAGNVSISQRAAGAMTIFGGSITMTGAATGIFVGGPTGANTVAFNGTVQLGLNAGSRMTGAGQPAVSVNHSGTASTTTFASLSIFTNLLTGIDAQNGGTLNVTAGVVDVVGQRALRIDNMSLGIALTAITQAGGSGGGPGVSLNATSGSLTSGATSLSNASQEGVSITGASGNLNFGGTTVAGAGAQGIFINGSSATIGFSPTTISGTGAQGIRVAGSTSNVSFGNTTITGGTQAIALQGNSGGTRSFGTLALTGPFLGLLNNLGGGNTTVAGAATITNPAVGVQVDGLSSGQAINFNSTLSIVNAGGTGVLIGTVLTNAATATLNLGTLSVSTSSGTAILAGSGGTSTPLTTSGAGLVTATGGPAINATNTTFNASFGDVSSTNSTTQGITLAGATGTLAMNGTTGAITGAAGTAFNLSGGTANVTYAGTITQNAAQFAVAATNMTGGTKTFSGAITSITSGRGISLTTNTGATIAFSGGLNLSTGAFPAFTATGGGTVTATQNNTTIVNTLTTTTGTALNVANTTIGAAGLTFRSISASGAANGIVLNTTGAGGGLTVSGNGSAGSGGTIQNTTADGISLTSTRDVSIDRMIVQNTAQNGIEGTGVVNFTFTNGTISNTGTAGGGQFEESLIAFNDSASFTENNVSGTVTITGNTLTQPRRNGIDISNWSGTISNLIISNNTLTGGTTTASIQHAIIVFSQGSASTTGHITTGKIQNNTISGFRFLSGGIFIGGSGIFVAGGNTGASTVATIGAAGTPIEISGNDVDFMGSNGIVVSFNGLQGLSNFNIHDNGTVGNPMSNMEGLGISVFFGGNGTFSGIVNNNAISTNGPTVHAGSAGIGVQVDQGTLTTDAPVASITVNNNSVVSPDGNGIRGIVRNSNGTLSLKVQNNTVGAPFLANRNGIRIDGGSAAGNTTLLLNLSGNTSAGSGVNQGIGLRKQGIVAATNSFGINALAPSPATAAQTATFVAGLNPAGSGVDIISGDNFVTCSLP